jgi:NADP-dependent 3-hydroxy acid dehydrogenase YdfG
MNKIAIVTGANSGIGKEIAKKLVANNIYTILACRNEKQGKEIEAKNQNTSIVTSLILKVWKNFAIR